MKRGGWAKLIAFALLAAGVFLLDRHFGWSDYLGDLDNLSFLQQLVRHNLWQAMLCYILITVVGCVVLALPGATFALFAGVLFGPWLGILLCLIATTLGACAAFVAGRFFLRDSLRPVVMKNRHLRRLLFEQDTDSELLVLMITRLVPLFPYNLQNFAYGITDIGFGKYAVCTFVFMLPGVSFFTIGAAGLAAEEGRGWYFAAAGVLFVLVLLLGMGLKRRYLDAADSEKHGKERKTPR